MVGFANANYWANAYTRTAAARQAVPHETLRRAVEDLAAQPQFTKDPVIAEWCATHGFVVVVRGSNDDKSNVAFFDPRAVHALCAAAMQQQQQQQGSSTLQTFAEQVATAEIRILTAHALHKAGFCMPNDDADDETQVATSPDDFFGNCHPSMPTRPRQ